MGDAQRPPTSGEQAEMAGLLEQGLRDGAVGLSIGLEYFPGRYAGSSEIAALAELVSRYDAVLAAHTRGISSLYEQGIAEAIGFADRSRCRLQIAHVNPMGRTNWEAIDALFARVDAARAAGLDVGFDIVAYTAWTLSALELLPYFVQDLGADAVLALAATDEGRKRLRELLDSSRPSWPPWIGETVTRNIPMEMGWENLILAEAGAKEFDDDCNETLAAVARTRGTDPYSVLFDLLLASGGGARIVNVGYGGDFEDETPLRRLAARPDAIPETDTVPVPVPGRGLQLPLPLFHGTMARFLGHFARDLGLFSVEQAVHRMTALPARRVRLERRGVLQEGAHADVVVFDPTVVGDRGTYLAPEPPAGIEHVFVNGRPVVFEGGYDPERLPGQVLRRTA
jgi:dihydroorotase/N-acyl-D-amino-acid deacylase